MTTLLAEDLNFILSRLPRDVVKMVQANGLFIAGGFIRATIAGEKVSDIDVFGSGKEQLKLLALELATARGGKMHETDNAFTVLTGSRLPVQFIHRWLYPLGAQSDLIAQFDYTIAQAVIWWQATDIGGEWASLVSDRFYSDLAAKRLFYTHPVRVEDAGGSILRARKFIAKGYNIQPLSFAGVIARLVRAVDWRQVDHGDEQQVTRVLTGLLREVDPLLVVDGVDLVDEHNATTEAA